MKIKRSEKNKLFSDIKPGECFSWREGVEGDIFLKLDIRRGYHVTDSGVWDYESSDRYLPEVNAVNLSDGLLYFFENECEVVKPVKGSFVED